MSVVLDGVESFDDPRKTDHDLICPDNVFQRGNLSLKPFRQSRQVGNRTKMVLLQISLHRISLYLQHLSDFCVEDKRFDQRLTFLDGGEIEEGLFEPLGEETGA